MQTDEISSTEKLLNVIRGKGDASTSTPVLKKKITPIKRFKKGGRFSVKKAVTVGVDIGFSELKLVKTRYNNSKHELLDYKYIPIVPHVDINSAEFLDLLTTSLTSFCGISEKVDVWTTMSNNDIEIRHITVPITSKKHITNSVIWTVKKETDFDATLNVLDYEIQDDIEVNGVLKKSIMVYSAPTQKVEELKTVFSRSGFPLTGITISSLALQNLFTTQWLPYSGEDIATLFIGTEYSHINIFSNEKLVVSRDIKAGANSMIEDLEKDIGNSATGFVDSKQIRKMFFNIFSDSPSLEKDPDFNFNEDQIFKMILPAVERLVRQVERTFEHYSIITNGERNVEKIYFCGEITTFKNLTSYIKEQLHIEQELINPFSLKSHLSINLTPPSTDLKRVTFTRVIGLALSSNSYTPNFMYTYKDKENQKALKYSNNIIMIVSFVLLIFSAGLYFWQLNQISSIKSQIEEVKITIDQYPYLDQKTVLEMALNVNKNQNKKKELSKKYLGMALISELSNLTQKNVSIVHLMINLNKKAKTKKDAQTVEIEGIITGKQRLMESTLSGYLLKLNRSRLFSQPILKKSSMEDSKLGKVLRFTLDMTIVNT